MGLNTKQQAGTEHTQEHQLDFLEKFLLPIQKHNFCKVYTGVNAIRNTYSKCSPSKIILLAKQLTDELFVLVRGKLRCRGELSMEGQVTSAVIFNRTFF